MKEGPFLFFCAYAPQTGLDAETKDAFWELLDEKTAEMPPEDYLIVGDDLNVHVGQREDTSVSCDRRMKDHLKSKIYWTAIRPVALYGTECWPATKEVERRLSVMETKMLRWTAGITTNDDIKKRFGVAPIQKKMQENRLRCFRHVLRAEDNSLAKSAYTFEVAGERPMGPPRQQRTDTVHNDLKAVRLHPHSGPCHQAGQTPRKKKEKKKRNNMKIYILFPVIRLGQE
ncbi:uncharacterized protein [Anabrus simplex]|uniref:uncharacterized protein n=1 Tax=Anabrus simplex TaxID=316456 RepID=UPI0035A3864A